MSGRKLLLDSNIIIYIAKKELVPESFIQADDSLFVSDVSFMETLGYSFADSAEKKETEAILSVIHRLPIDEPVVQKVIETRQLRKMKLPDAIIAATGLVNDCTVVSRNLSDFLGLAGLNLLNPFDSV